MTLFNIYNITFLKFVIFFLKIVLKRIPKNLKCWTEKVIVNNLEKLEFRELEPPTCFKIPKAI